MLEQLQTLPSSSRLLDRERERDEMMRDVIETRRPVRTYRSYTGLRQPGVRRGSAEQPSPGTATKGRLGQDDRALGSGDHTHVTSRTKQRSSEGEGRAENTPAESSSTLNPQEGLVASS